MTQARHRPQPPSHVHPLIRSRHDVPTDCLVAADLAALRQRGGAYHRHGAKPCPCPRIYAFDTSAPPAAARRGRRCHLYRDAGRIPAFHSPPASHLARRWVVGPWLHASVPRCASACRPRTPSTWSALFALRVAHAGKDPAGARPRRHSASSALTQREEASKAQPARILSSEEQLFCKTSASST